MPSELKVAATILYLVMGGFVAVLYRLLRQPHDNMYESRKDEIYATIMLWPTFLFILIWRFLTRKL